MDTNRINSISLGDLASLVDGTVFEGMESLEITGLAALDKAGPGDLSFLTNPRYKYLLETTRAGVILTGETLEKQYGFAVLKVSNPYLALAKILTHFHPVSLPEPGIHSTAVIGNNFRSGDNVSVSSHVTIGADVSIGSSSTILPGAFIGDNTTIGEHCIINPNVTICHGTVIGSRVIIHAGAVIGSDGFGFARDGAKYIKVPQVGHVVVEDDVEIGANTTIDRGSMGVTRICRGTKLDNLIQLAHNVVIGEDTAIAAQTGISGSTQVGTRVTMGGQVGVNGHIKIGDDSILTAKSGITKSISPKSIISGFPPAPHRRWLRNQSVLNHGVELKKQIQKLETELDSLKIQMEKLLKEREI